MNVQLLDKNYNLNTFSLSNFKDAKSKSRDKIKDLLDHTLDDMELMLGVFDDSHHKNELRSKILVDDLEKIQIEEKVVQEKINELNAKITNLNFLINENQKTILKRSDKMKTLCNKLKLAFDSEIEFDTILAKACTSLEEKQSAYDAAKQEENEKIVISQKKIDKLTIDSALANSRLDTERENLKKIDKQYAEIKEKLSANKLTGPDVDVDALTEKIEAAKIDLKKFENDNDLEKLKKSRDDGKIQ